MASKYLIAIQFHGIPAGVQGREAAFYDKTCLAPLDPPVAPRFSRPAGACGRRAGRSAPVIGANSWWGKDFPAMATGFP